VKSGGKIYVQAAFAGTATTPPYNRSCVDQDLILQN
jgi:hypothetical protein